MHLDCYFHTIISHIYLVYLFELKPIMFACGRIRFEYFRYRGHSSIDDISIFSRRKLIQVSAAPQRAGLAFVSPPPSKQGE